MVYCQATAYASTPAVDLCVPTKHTVGFFNGIWNSYDDATYGLNGLVELVPPLYGGRLIPKEVFYNQTGCDKPDRTCLEDIAEVFMQRAQEIDPTGTLGARMDIFDESMDLSEKTITNQVIQDYPPAKDIFDDLHTRLSVKLVAAMAKSVSNPPTQVDYATHNARLDALGVEGRSMLLVAHSQGNLFLNQAYDHIQPAVGEGRVKTVQIAPASPTLRGPHVLANTDIVINALRLQGLDTVPAINLDQPFSTSDLSGHGLAASYLEPSRPGRAMVEGLISNALQALERPDRTAQAAGSFTVTLTWDGDGDEDLHVHEPDDSHVFYLRRQGHSGYLDTDNTSRLGPEHYHASCDPNQLQTGTYRIGVNNYWSADGRIATVQVATARDGVLLSRQIATGPTLGSAGNESPQSVMTLQVDKDPATGDFTFAAL